MKFKLTLCLLLFLWGVVGCTKENLAEQQQAHAEQAIHQAELLQNNPNDAMATLETIADLVGLDDALLVRWCLAYGEATNELRKNELLSLPLFARAYSYCNEQEAFTEKAKIGFFLGNAQAESKEGVRAMELYLNSLSLANLCNEYKLAGNICSALGKLYLEKEMPAQAKEKYEAAIDYYRQANDLLGQVRALANVAYALIYSGSPQDALIYARKADEVATIGGNQFAMGIAASVQARIYKDLGDYASAESYVLKGIKLDTVNPAPHYVTLAEIYIHQKKFEKARVSLQKAETSKSLNKYTPMTIALYRSQIDEEEGKIDAAQANHKRYIFLRDSLSIPAKDYQLLEVEKNVKELKAQIAIDQQEAEAKNMVLWLVLVGAVLLVVAVTCYFLYHPYFRRFLANRAIMRELYALDIKKEIIEDHNELLERECRRKANKVLFGEDDNEGDNLDDYKWYTYYNKVDPSKRS